MLLALPARAAAQAVLLPDFLVPDLSSGQGARPQPGGNRAAGAACAGDSVAGTLADSSAAVADSLGEGDDLIPAEALSPESGMVLISHEGRELHSVPVASAPVASVADALATPRPQSAPAGGGAERYAPASSGSGARSRCAAAMTPPPSTTASSL